MAYERSYMVVSHGVKKDSGEVYSKAYRIKKSDGLRNGNPYAYLDEKDRYFINGEIRDLGTIINLQMSEV